MYLYLLVALLTPDWAAHTYDLSPLGPDQVTLSKSLWERGDPVEERITLRKHISGDLNGDKKPEAILLFEYWGGGAEKQDFVAIYTAGKKGWGRAALLDGGASREGPLFDVALAEGQLDVGHEVLSEDLIPMVVVRRYRLLPRGLESTGVVDFKASNPAKPLPDLKARKKKARALLSNDPAAGARAYVGILQMSPTPAALGDAAFALMKAKHPLAKDALEAAAFRAADGKQKGAAYYNLARYHLDQKDEEAALQAVRASLKHRPDNEPTKKLLTLLQAGLGVRAIDWRNRSYAVEDAERTLADGRWEKQGEDFGESLDLVDVTYGELTGDTAEEAVVHLNYWGGGTGRFDSILVFDAKGQKIAELPGGDRADGGVASANIKDGAVVLSRMYSGLDGGACCPEFTVDEIWRFDGNRFVEVEGQATLSTFGDEAVDESKVPGVVAKADKLAREGNTYDAGQLLQTVLDTQKHQDKVYSLFGFCLMQNDHWGAAPVLRASLRFADSDKAKAAVYYNIGRAYEKNLRYDDNAQKQAIAAFEKSLKLRPGNEPTETALARVKAWKKK